MKQYEYKNPTLVDALIVDLAEKLESLSWLNNIFGLAEMIERTELSHYKIPAYRNSNADYIPLIPLGNYENYCFFEQSGDYERLDNNSFAQSWFKTDFSIIFFVNIAKIYKNEAGTLQNLNLELINFFNYLKTLPSGKFEFKTLTNDFNEIYNNYSIKKTDKQYSDFPYASVKISGEAILFSQPLVCDKLVGNYVAGGGNSILSGGENILTVYK